MTPITIDCLVAGAASESGVAFLCHLVDETYRADTHAGFGLRRLSCVVVARKVIGVAHHTSPGVSHTLAHAPLGAFNYSFPVGTFRRDPDENFWAELEGRKLLPFLFKEEVVAFRSGEDFAVFCAARGLFFWIKIEGKIGIGSLSDIRKSKCSANRWAIDRLKEFQEGL